MSHLPDYWRRCAWLAVSAAIAGFSYWMFFTGAIAGHPERSASAAVHRDIRSIVPPAAATPSLTDAKRPK